MKIRKILCILLLLVLSGLYVYTEDAPFYFKITPGVSIPIGSDIDFFNFGAGSNLEGILKLPFYPNLVAGLGAGYHYIALQDEDKLFLSTIPIRAGVGLDWEFLQDLFLTVYGSSGIAYCFLNDENSSGTFYPFFSGSVGLSYKLIPSLSINTSVTYRNYINLFQDIQISLGTSYYIGAKAEKRIDRNIEKRPSNLKQTGLELIQVELETVFPVFYKYYDDHPVGNTTLLNWEKENIEDIKVSFYVKEYMVNPKECSTLAKIKAGEQKQIELFGLFTNKILEITEGSKVSTNIIVEYTHKGTRYQEEFIETLSLYDRNAITWDDDRKAAAFVTTKDPTVLKFARNIAGSVKDKASLAINSNLLTALALYESLKAFGMKYIKDPSSSYETMSKDKLKVDFLQFPRQTLNFKSGDCDDLSVLYCTLLESLGVETSFITIPGHIFAAFSIEMIPERARKNFSDAGDFIFIDDKTWVPVEVTVINEGFLNAWKKGAKQWREHSAIGQAGFFPMEKSWELYEPVGFTEPTEGIALPSEDKIVRMFLEEVVKFIDREIYSREKMYKESVSKTNNSSKALNRLGTLYARYGLYDKALAQYNKILAKEEYMPVLVNVGNIYFLQNNLKEAIKYYTRAQKMTPENPTVLLCIARTNHEIENYKQSTEAFSKLKNVDSHLAEEFAYLELKSTDTSRAQEQSKLRGVILWEEE